MFVFAYGLLNYIYNTPSCKYMMLFCWSFFDTTLASANKPPLLYNGVMDSLASLISEKDFQEPPEIAAIKRYVHDTYDSEVGVQVRDTDILVLVDSAALASRLRYDTPALQTAATTKKRIVLRINN